MSKIRVLHLPINSGGVAYYRHHLPVIALAANGKVEVVTTPSRGAKTWFEDVKGAEEWLLKAVEGVDIIHMGWSNRVGHLEMAVAMREKAKARLLIDYDDDVLSVEQFNVHYAHYHEAALGRKVARMGMNVADGVTVSTGPLVEALKGECRTTYHLPNYTHPPHWLDAPVDPRRREDKSVRVMFAGGPSHLGDLAQVKEAVEWAIGHYDGKEGRPHVKFIFACCMPDWAAKYIEDDRTAVNNRVFYVQGTGDDTRLWQRVLRWVKPDVMMAPLLHNAFNKSKSLIRGYDAAMCEAALVCEDGPTYAEIPDSACARVNGPCHTYPNWMDALGTLIENADLRRDLATKLHSYVLDNRTISTYISKWEEAYAAALATPIVSSLSDVVRPRILGSNGQPARDTD